jgi:signal peptidase II
MSPQMIITSILICDQTTKFLARSFLDINTPISYLYGLVQLALVFNSNGFASIFNRIPTAYTRIFLIPGVAFLLIICTFTLYRLHKINSKFSIPLALVIAGGTGNLIDRIFYNGAVTDFISIGISTFRTGIFNVADLALVAGSFGIGHLLFSSSMEQKNR